MPDSCRNPAKPDRKERLVPSLPAAYVNGSSIAFTKQTIKPIYRQLERVFGGIRSIRNPEPPERIGGLAAYLAWILAGIGAIMDGGDLVTGINTAAKSWNPANIDQWTIANFIILMVGGFVISELVRGLWKAIQKFNDRR